MTGLTRDPAYAPTFSPPVDCDALAEAARYVTREWGAESGYRARVVAAGYRTVALEVTARDGGIFYVAADRWGNTRHGEHLEAFHGELAALEREAWTP